MATVKLTEKPLGSDPTSSTHFLITQLETIEGQVVESVRRLTKAQMERWLAGDAPLMAKTAAAMTDTGKMYLYLGTETGYTAQHIYAYDGDESAWVDVGLYGSTRLDGTMTEADMAPPAKTVGDAISALNYNISALAAGTPTAVSTVAGMSDTAKLYVYTGSESGYTAGHWYYYNGSAWTDGGQYGFAQVDTSLTVSGAAADAEATGSRIDALPSTVTPEETDADLYICDSDGNVIAKFEDGHIITKNFDSSNISTDIFLDTSSTTADLYICDTFGNVIAEFLSGHIKVKNFDSSDYSSVLSDVATLQSDVDTLKLNTNGILYRNKDVTDGVYAACRYHQPNKYSKQFCMLMGGDIHSDRTRLASMVEYLNALDCFDCGIMLGDIAGNTWADDATYYTSCISATEKPFLTVIGNHDAGSGNTLTTSYTNVADLVAKFITPNIQYADLADGEYTEGNSYYYKDFTDYGIRIIVLNQYEYPTDNDGSTFAYTRGSNCYSQEQIDWLISTLNSTPSNYGVIMAQHFVPYTIIFDRTGIWTSSEMEYNSYGADTMFADESKTCIVDIVNAWINGTAINQSYDYNVSGGSWSGVSVIADFTSRGTGEFITWIGGHLHQSLLGYINRYSDQKCYLVDCTGLSASTQGDTPRKAGTRSEDCLCALAVDREKKTVKLFRIGAHFTNDGIDRLYGQYTYGGE